MELKLNGQKINFSLQNEKSVHDFLDSLSVILAQDNLVIASAEVDGKSYAVGDEPLKDIQIDNTGLLSVEAMTREDLVNSLLGETKRLLQNIAADLKTNGFSNAARYLDLFNWVHDTVELINRHSVFNMVEAKLILSTIRQIRDYLQSDTRDDSKSVSMAAIVASLVEYIEAIEIKMSNNFTIKRDDLKNAIEEGLNLLPEISSDFQLGKDKDALSKINRVISVIEFSCLYLKKNRAELTAEQKEDVDDLYEEMNSLLSEVVEAFENGDVVLIGDLLEYELPEKLEKYRSIVLED